MSWEIPLVSMGYPLWLAHIIVAYFSPILCYGENIHDNNPSHQCEKETEPLHVSSVPKWDHQQPLKEHVWIDYQTWQHSRQYGRVQNVSIKHNTGYPIRPINQIFGQTSQLHNSRGDHLQSQHLTKTHLTPLWLNCLTTNKLYKKTLPRCLYYQIYSYCI